MPHGKSRNPNQYMQRPVTKSDGSSGLALSFGVLAYLVHRISDQSIGVVTAPILSACVCVRQQLTNIGLNNSA